MATTWLGHLFILTPLMVGLTDTVAAQPHIRIDLDQHVRVAAELSIAGALRRLERAKCQAVFADFSIPWPDAPDPVPIWFVDGDGTAACAAEKLAFTSPGSRVVHLCAERFNTAFLYRRPVAEAIVIHEILHVYGLSENPPASEMITRRVVERCLR